LHRRSLDLVILALTLTIGDGSMPIGPAGTAASGSAVRPLSTPTPAGPGAGRQTAATAAEFRFKPIGLSSLHACARGKIPVVLVHGLWGGPRLWKPMVKALEADPSVSGRFQFLSFAYSGDGSIPHSAFLLRRELRTLRDRLDPDRSDPSWDRMVLIGHSMGGLLCKMMAQDSGSKLLDLITDRPVEELVGPAEALELLRGEMVYKPLPEVRRLIFIATPHRGSPIDREPIRAIASSFVRPSAGLQQAHASLLAANGPEAFSPAFRAGLPTSIDQLAWRHPLLLAIDGLPIDPRIERHSIIADRRNPPQPDGGDGEVPYASSHLPGATSELLVNGWHLCLANPEVIAEVARLLKEHATDRDRPSASPGRRIGLEKNAEPQPRSKADRGRQYHRDRTGAIVPARNTVAPGVNMTPTTWSERS
jgi:pimeloyl-ACP methyl ester carboxylesterase